MSLALVCPATLVGSQGTLFFLCKVTFSGGHCHYDVSEVWGMGTVCAKKDSRLLASAQGSLTQRVLLYLVWEPSR